LKINDVAFANDLMKAHKMKFYSKKRVGELPKPILITRYLHDSNYLE
jgi:hypothetical protein